MDLRSKEVIAEPAIRFTAGQIAEKVGQLASTIRCDYESSDGLVLVGVLKGGVVFLCDLLRRLDLKAEVDFIRVSSYGTSRASSGVVEIISDLSTSLVGKDVLVVD